MMLHDSPLGKTTLYKSTYSPELLFPIARAENRSKIGIIGEPCFSGVDNWNAYEFSWLDNRGKPEVAIAEFYFPYDSINIVESKSFKLYLNSFNQTKFSDIHAVKNVLEQDLLQATESAVRVNLITPQQFSQFAFQEFSGVLLDELPIRCEVYQPDARLLTTQHDFVTEILYSHLLKSNCPITGQPDWGSVMFHYEGQQINHEGLLQYIVSFREHNDFHEHCVERMFMDIMRQCKPEKLTVYARYTRRGGLDINPFRSNFAAAPANYRQGRQ